MSPHYCKRCGQRIVRSVNFAIHGYVHDVSLAKLLVACVELKVKPSHAARSEDVGRTETAPA